MRRRLARLTCSALMLLIFQIASAQTGASLRDSLLGRWSAMEYDNGSDFEFNDDGSFYARVYDEGSRTFITIKGKWFLNENSKTIELSDNKCLETSG